MIDERDLGILDGIVRARGGLLMASDSARVRWATPDLARLPALSA